MTDKQKITAILKAYTKKHNIFASSVILEEYAEELVKQGAILPPCKVGQTVWVIPKGLHEVCKATIVRIEYNYYSSPQEWLVVEYVSSIVGIQEHKSRIDLMLGKTVFLTKEEAEEKLKELGK